MSYQPNQRLSEQPQRDSHTTHSSQEQHNYNTPEAIRNVFSPDEIRVLRECNRESLYYRCLPLSVLFSGLAYIAMKNGYLKKGTTYQYFPKMALGVFIGYIGGKISYKNTCEEKMMKLPDSKLANALRKRHGITPTTGSDEAPVLEDYTLDLRDHIEGLDTYDPIGEDLSSYQKSDLATDVPSSMTSTVTYDDLRKANREDYMTGRFRKQSPDASRSSIHPSSNSTYLQNTRQSSIHEADVSSISPPTVTTSKNKYGDEWSI